MTDRLYHELNKQINEELFSGYLYLSMAAFAKGRSLDGFANWFEIQAKEELDHAMGFYHYLLDVRGSVELLQLGQPQAQFDGPQVLFAEGLKHEQHITGRINYLFEIAGEEKDYALQALLKWYLNEQVEEEANATKYVERMQLVGMDGAGLLALDRELAKREYSPLNPRGE